MLFEAMEGWVEGAFFDLEQLVGGALDVQNDAVAMEAAALGEGLENEEIETALEVVFAHPAHPYVSWYGIVGLDD